MRRTQLYVDEAQYRWLKSQADGRGSIAAVVRGLIDVARGTQEDASGDPLIRHQKRSTVQTLDDDLYGR